MLSNIDIVMLCVNSRVGGRRLFRVAITVKTIQDLIIDAPPRCVSPLCFPELRTSLVVAPPVAGGSLRSRKPGEIGTSFQTIATYASVDTLS